MQLLRSLLSLSTTATQARAAELSSVRALIRLRQPASAIDSVRLMAPLSSVVAELM